MKHLTRRCNKMQLTALRFSAAHSSSSSNHCPPAKIGRAFNRWRINCFYLSVYLSICLFLSSLSHSLTHTYTRAQICTHSSCNIIISFATHHLLLLLLLSSLFLWIVCVRVCVDILFSAFLLDSFLLSDSFALSWRFFWDA